MTSSLTVFFIIIGLKMYTLLYYQHTVKSILENRLVFRISKHDKKSLYSSLVAYKATAHPSYSFKGCKWQFTWVTFKTLPASLMSEIH